MITEQEMRVVFRTIDGTPQTEIQIKDTDNRVIARHISIETTENLMSDIFVALGMEKQMKELKARVKDHWAKIAV